MGYIIAGDLHMHNHSFPHEEGNMYLECLLAFCGYTLLMRCVSAPPCTGAKAEVWQGGGPVELWGDAVHPAERGAAFLG